MKKIYYESPSVEVVDVRVEAGFQNSGDTNNYANGGIDDYGIFGEGNMDEIGSY